MKNRIPNPPLAARLSESARETELRPRSIFQRKKKRPPAAPLILAALAALLCGSLVSCQPRQSAAENQAREPLSAESPTEAPAPEHMAAMEVAPLEGEAVSPDGKYEIRLVGRNEGITAGGLVPPEYVQVCDVQTGKVLWQDMGYYRQAASWPPTGEYLALARTARDYGTVTVIRPGNWTQWEVTLPGGDGILTCGSFPDDEPWIEWTGNRTFSLIVTGGGEGDTEARRSFLCVLREGAKVTGHTADMMTETLPGEYDLDHDGAPETLELMTVGVRDGGAVEYHELRVFTGAGELLWTGHAGASHAGWNSLFACTLDGEDYLLQYNPTMYQGYCTYHYRLFSLGPEGEELLFRENGVEFDIDGIGATHSFDAEAIAGFMEEVNGFLAQSKLLVNTDEALKGIDPKAPRDDLGLLKDDYSYFGYQYDETRTMRDNLVELEKAVEALRQWRIQNGGYEPG